MKKSLVFSVIFILLLIGFVNFTSAVTANKSYQNIREPIESLDIAWYDPFGPSQGKLELIGPVAENIDIADVDEPVRNSYTLDGVSSEGIITLTYDRDIDKDGGIYLLRNSKEAVTAVTGFELHFNFYNNDDEDDDDNEEELDDDIEEGSANLSDDDSEDETKVCCKIIKTEDDNRTEIEYDYKELDDCSRNEKKKRSEIVNDSFCQEKNESKIEVKEKNRIKFEGKTGQECPEECTCTGVVMKCQLASGREMTIFAGNSGNVIVQVKGVNVSTNVTLYKENETIYGNFSNKTKEIKIFPDEAREKIKEKMKAEMEEESEIELEDDGFYKIEGKKKSKLFGVFSVNEHVQAKVSIEDGETNINSPWWGFLANDKEDDS